MSDVPDVPLRGRYQDKLAPALPQRLALLDRVMPAPPASVLDIGSNLGDITAHYAAQGHWSLGIESSAAMVREARDRHPELERGAFMHGTVTPDTLGALPTVDVVLLLSVHHHWLGTLGPEVAGQMLRQVTEKARSVVVFESASRNARFEKYPPGFVDNDEASVTSYHEGYLAEHVGDLVRVERLGKAPCVGAREPYRWVWALHTS